jgi:hypothetical protein
MSSELINWNTASIIVVSVLIIHAGIKFINKWFDKPNNKKNSLF